MALSSCAVPVPSEIVLPFSGFLVFSGRFELWLVLLTAVLGDLIGISILYLIGLKGGRPFFEKRRFFFNHKKFYKAENWLQRYGTLVIFFGRIIPIVRSYITLPIGVYKLNFKKVLFYSFSGSLIWFSFLTYLGFKFGENWHRLQVYFRKFDLVILAAMIIFVIYWIYRRKVKNLKK